MSAYAELYPNLRPSMQSGDLLAVSGKGWVSTIIQRWTHSRYSHVGMILRFDEIGVDRVILLHSTTKTGVVPVPLSDYLLSLRGSAWWVPMKHSQIGIVDHQRLLRAHSFKYFGKGYDWHGALKHGLRFLTQEAHNYYCSELVSQIARDTGLSIPPQITPARLVAYPYYQQPVAIRHRRSDHAL